MLPEDSRIDGRQSCRTGKKVMKSWGPSRTSERDMNPWGVSHEEEEVRGRHKGARIKEERALQSFL